MKKRRENINNRSSIVTIRKSVSSADVILYFLRCPVYTMLFLLCFLTGKTEVRIKCAINNSAENRKCLRGCLIASINWE